MSFDSLTKDAWNTLKDTSFQASNKFNLFVYKTISLSSLLSPALDVLSTLEDSRVMNIYLQTITFPASTGVTYERLHEQTYLNDIAYPGDITMTFLETEKGEVMRFLRSWMNDIYAEPDFLNVGNVLRSNAHIGNAPVTNGYMVRSNQVGAKRTGLLLMQPKEAKQTLKYPRIMFYGLKLLNIGEVSLDQKSTEPVTLTATFNAERIFIPSII